MLPKNAASITTIWIHCRGHLEEDPRRYRQLCRDAAKALRLGVAAGRCVRKLPGSPGWRCWVSPMSEVKTEEINQNESGTLGKMGWIARSAAKMVVWVLHSIFDFISLGDGCLQLASFEANLTKLVLIQMRFVCISTFHSLYSHHTFCVF